MNAKLTEEIVATIRKVALPDSKYAEIYGVRRLAILRARVGQTFRHVKTKPRTKAKPKLDK